MPFENPQAAPAPTRRSSRLRTSAPEATAAGVTAAASEDNAPVSEASPSSRPRRTVRLTVAEAVALAAALTAEDAPASAAATASAQAKAASSRRRSPRAESRPADRTSEEPQLDAFTRAARTFGTAPESVSTPVETSTPLETTAPASVAGEPSSAAPAAHVAPRRAKSRRIVAFGATVGVMGVAGMLAVSMTLPAGALAVAGGQNIAATSLVAGAVASDEADDEIQAYVTSSDVQNETLDRSEGFSTVSLVEVASEQGIKFSDSVFTNNPDAAIQWPFMVGVGMSSGYGPRWGTMHQGIDFVPGEGAPIQAIAAGTVRIATEQGGGYGVTVYIDHVIDGQVITSHYSHMQYGSLKVAAGDTVEVGDIVGSTGNTGHSFGAHLHFEIIVNGSTIDPLPWLQANAGRDSLG